MNNSHRTFHGALLDAEILADVYLAMTGGQVSLNLANNSGNEQNNQQQIGLVRRGALKVVSATVDEVAAHEKRLDLVQKKGGSCLWRNG